MHALSTLVTTSVDGRKPQGFMDRTTGRMAGCAPKAKMASGSVDIAPAKFAHTIGGTDPPAAVIVGVVEPDTCAAALPP